MINLRPIQREKIDLLKSILETSNEVCLAGSVGSGKTVMAMQFIEETPGLFYIQTYGQTVILDMWQSRMNISMSPEAISRTTIGLPHSYKKKSKIKYDYIVIDEAHQFTHADMTQQIISDNPQAKILYLTATPSPFVLRNTPIVCLSGLDLFKLGYSSDVYLGVVSTNTNVGSEDRNASLNVSTEALDALHENVPQDMNKLYLGIIKRLKQIEILKSRPILSKRMTWMNTFATLHKTIFFCESIKQAAGVINFLESKAIKCVSSNSKNDPNSEKIREFEVDETIKALVVVDRAQAGFDMPGLVNVVDMTFTHNPNRLYQMYGRVTRLSPDHDLKFFFKITNEQDSFYTKFYMNVMVNMLDETFITSFNGKNLNDMEIRVRVQKERTEKEESDEEKEKEPKSKQYKIDEDFFNTISVNDHFKFIESQFGKEFNEFAMIKISELRSVTFGYVFNDSKGKKQQLLEMAKSKKEKPYWKTKLGHSLKDYINRSSRTYDESFTNELKELNPIWFETHNSKQMRNSFDRMMESIPEGTKFKENQEWKGSQEKHWFVCEKYGEFLCLPNRAIGSWKKGLTGHPKDGFEVQKIQQDNRRVKIRNISIGEIYESLKDAAASIKTSESNIIAAIKRNGACKGYKWEYVDE